VAARDVVGSHQGVGLSGPTDSEGAASGEFDDSDSFRHSALPSPDGRMVTAGVHMHAVGYPAARRATMADPGRMTLMPVMEVTHP